MGQTFSELINSERVSWIKPHELMYNKQSRDDQSDLVNRFKIKSSLKLCYTENIIHDFNYQHWFVTDDTWTVEFGGGQTLDAVVTIHNDTKTPYVVHKTFEFNEVVRDRITKVIGASNYSLALRNCEHLARYIQSGAWVCNQMVGTGVLIDLFRTHLEQFSKQINVLPKELKPKEHEHMEIYKTLQYINHLKFTMEKSCLTTEDNEHYNILFLGPTGSGKSTLINHLYNSTVLVTDDTASSVTKQVLFTEGEYIMPEEQPMRKMNLIDTIGMCDSSLSRSEVYDMVKDSVQMNLVHIDKVVVVCAGRIESNHVAAIKDFMKWLKYDQYKGNFVFIYNKCDGQTQAKKELNLQTMCNKLGVDTSMNVCKLDNADGTKQDVNMNFAIGFPPDADYERVKDDLHTLVQGILTPNNLEKRIKIDRYSTCWNGI